MNFIFSTDPAKPKIQSDLFYDPHQRRDHPKWQAGMPEKQRILW
jgi:hypothetical protein